MIAFIDAHRGDYGVEPICRVLPIAPSTYHDHAVKQRDPSRLPPRAQRDLALKPEILRVHAENFGVYGVARCGGRCGAKGLRSPDALSSG
jgi:putative transposase